MISTAGANYVSLTKRCRRHWAISSRFLKHFAILLYIVLIQLFLLPEQINHYYYCNKSSAAAEMAAQCCAFRSGENRVGQLSGKITRKVHVRGHESYSAQTRLFSLHFNGRYRFYKST